MTPSSRASTIPQGSLVITNVGAANHDPTRWADGDEFDIFREIQPHIAFGVGVHMCLGMHLARMEMASATNRLLDRCPNLRPDPDRWDADDVHIHGERFRSPDDAARSVGRVSERSGAHDRATTGRGGKQHRRGAW